LAKKFLKKIIAQMRSELLEKQAILTKIGPEFRKDGKNP
jgi:hypothetical protein